MGDRFELPMPRGDETLSDYWKRVAPVMEAHVNAVLAGAGTSSAAPEGAALPATRCVRRGADHGTAPAGADARTRACAIADEATATWRRDPLRGVTTMPSELGHAVVDALIAAGWRPPDGPPYGESQVAEGPNHEPPPGYPYRAGIYPRRVRHG